MQKPFEAACGLILFTSVTERARKRLNFIDVESPIRSEFRELKNVKSVSNRLKLGMHAKLVLFHQMFS